MSLWERSGWKGGFPFSPTRLGPLGRAVRGQGGDVDVTAASICDKGATLPRTTPAALSYGRIVVPDALTVRVTPASRRTAPRRASLRLLPIGAFTWGSATPPVQPRTRPDHTLIWVTGGRMRLDFPRNGTILEPGDVRFIPSGTAFAARPRAGAEGHVLLISPELVAEVDPPLPRSVTAGCIGQGAAVLAATLQALVEEAARSPDRKALDCYLNVLSLRLSRLDPERDRRTPAGAALADRPLVDRFLALSASEIGSDRTLADLAQDLGTTLTQLDRACLQARGRRAIDLVHEQRLERAAELLRHTDRPTPRIAQDLGYASHGHFTRIFVAATGRTPETYRQQMTRTPD
ncbi:MAG: helix-turn-helix domain-containing protein [Paracoccus hibiscisoli]|uniref:helix-turn-helix domain-containing protein n=1 Tax=Paracoccus hibiscisoli TaxID=2023261 RepID=UPI0039189774